MRKLRPKAGEKRDMSDLQLALLLLGAVIILSVMAFNWWQERKLKNEAAKHFEPPREDVLMDDEFQFDPDAILREESNDEHQIADETFDSFGGDVDEEGVSTQEQQLSTVESMPLSGDQSTMPDSEDAPVTAAATTSEQQPLETEADTLKSYEEHVWHSESIESSSTLSPEALSARNELMREAGFDDADQSIDAIEHNDQSDDSAVFTLSPEIDRRIDLIALLHLPQPVSGAKLREFLISVTDIDKPKYLHGLDTDGNWLLPTREHEMMEFTKVTCAVQLADRSGFISRIGLNRFQHEVERIGHKLNAQIEWLNQGDAWQQASELDQFCIEVDKMVGFHLVQGENGPFTGTKFRGLAEAGGMILGNDGGFHSENDHGQRLFTIINRENRPFSPEMLRTSVIHGVTFQLDIPRVANCLEVFNQMVLSARKMEKSLGAVIVDDNQRPLGDPQIDIIRQQLKVIHAKMVTRGIIPGSTSALRLFS
jgi:FtsZ-interacting cell division protein ZipA